MKVYFKTGGRGRPLSIDIEESINMINRNIPKVAERLKQFRKESSGYRGERLIGSETDLPEYISSTKEALTQLGQGEQFSKAVAQEIRKNLKLIRDLASKQERVYGRAISNEIYATYRADIEKKIAVSSNFAKKQYEQILRRLENMSPVEREKYLFSKKYQDVKTFDGTGGTDMQRIINWAEEKTGRSMSQDEAIAYLLNERSKGNEIEEF